MGSAAFLCLFPLNLRNFFHIFCLLNYNFKKYLTIQQSIVTIMVRKMLYERRNFTL